MKRLPLLMAVAAGFSAVLAAPAAQAQVDAVRKILLLDNLEGPGETSRIITAPYTFHYRPSPNHRPTFMLGGEKEYGNGVLLGAAYFSNSFGQDSATIYRGGRFRNWSWSEKLYTQWTAGLMYGYKPPYNDEVPLNFRGFSPMAVLAVGWQFTPKYALQLNALGAAAVMFQLSYEMP